MAKAAHLTVDLKNPLCGYERSDVPISLLLVADLNEFQRREPCCKYCLAYIKKQDALMVRQCVRRAKVYPNDRARMAEWLRCLDAENSLKDQLARAQELVKGYALRVDSLERELHDVQKLMNEQSEPHE